MEGRVRPRRAREEVWGGSGRKAREERHRVVERETAVNLALMTLEELRSLTGSAGVAALVFVEGESRDEGGVVRVAGWM